MALLSAVLIAVFGYWLTKQQERRKETMKSKAKLYAEFLAVNGEYYYTPKSVDLNKRYTAICDELCIYAHPQIVHQIALLHKTDYKDNNIYANLVKEMRKDIGDNSTISTEDVLRVMELNSSRKTN